MKRSSETLRADARAVWQAGVDAVAPSRLIGRVMRLHRDRIEVGGQSISLARVARIAVVGAGKAGSAMSHAVEQALGDRLMREKQLVGCVNVPDRCVVPLERLRLHPSRSAPDNKPTRAGVEGARRIGEIVDNLGANDLLLCLISGGGSALLPAPVAGVSLEDKQAVTSLLHASGATIGEMNAVRKHLSQFKGGGLARRFRGRWLVSLIISDVIGDPIDVIASGPTAADPTTFADALAVLAKYAILDRCPSPARTYLEAGAAGRHPETLKRLPRGVTNCVIGSNATALDAASRMARRLGYHVLNLSSFIEGESQQAGIVLAGIARGVRDQGKPVAPPACIVSGGETVVSLGAEHGLGGRNQELVLAALAHLGADGFRDIVILSGGTDGEDGPTDAAGAFADESLARAATARGLVPNDFLRRHDSYHFFEAAGGLIKLGLTDTNVADLRVMLVGTSRG